MLMIFGGIAALAPDGALFFPGYVADGQRREKNVEIQPDKIRLANILWFASMQHSQKYDMI